MLTKSQAQAAADALVEGGQTKRMARLEASAARIPPYYRSRSLSRVPSLGAKRSSLPKLDGRKRSLG